VCPSCKKDSYTASVETFRPCPYCGNSFSGKYGPEKRNGHRIKKAFPFTISHNGSVITANICNFSENGIGIKIAGDPSIPVGATVVLKIGNYNTKARLIWMIHNNNSSIAGIKILDRSLNYLFNFK
jgi:hypothetical protein